VAFLGERCITLTSVMILFSAFLQLKISELSLKCTVPFALSRCMVVNTSVFKTRTFYEGDCGSEHR